MNWGQGIAVFMTIFILSIVAVVYKAYQTSAQLVAEDYYSRELAYQGTIDARELGRHMEKSLSIVVIGEEVIVSIDPLEKAELIAGAVHFYRPSDAGLDRDYSIIIGGEELRIPMSDFQKGLYRLELRWMDNGQEHLAVLEEVHMP